MPLPGPQEPSEKRLDYRRDAIKQTVYLFAGWVLVLLVAADVPDVGKVLIEPPIRLFDDAAVL